MRFAVVLHGPEVLDTGLGQKVISILRSRGEVVAVMSGITGVAAVIDAGLEDEVDISRRLKPSVELARMDAEADRLLLVNSAKSESSALRFGSIVYSRCAKDLTKPLLQVDATLIIEWNAGAGDIAGLLAEHLGIRIIKDAPAAIQIPAPGWRELGGVLPGESVWIDGVVVGKAISDRVRIGKDAQGRLMAEGIVLKETGVRRLGTFDVQRAHVRSGRTRRTSSVARAIDSPKRGVFLIDHDAEAAAYRCRNAALVITVGDDTSKIAGSLLYRFSVPVVSITDGDEDGISQEDIRSRGSVVLRLIPGTDDVVGAEVRRAMFGGGDHLEGPLTPDEAAAIIAQMAGDRLIGMDRS